MSKDEIDILFENFVEETDFVKKEKCDITYGRTKQRLDVNWEHNLELQKCIEYTKKIQNSLYRNNCFLTTTVNFFCEKCKTEHILLVKQREKLTTNINSFDDFNNIYYSTSNYICSKCGSIIRVFCDEILTSYSIMEER